MAKGAWMGVLKDDADLGALPIKPGLAVMLMGSADVVAAPTAPVRRHRVLSYEAMYILAYRRLQAVHVNYSSLEFLCF
jgi:hypothetical protein